MTLWDLDLTDRIPIFERNIELCPRKVTIIEKRVECV